MEQKPSQNPYSIGAPKSKGPDSRPVGFLIGILFPLLGLLVLYFILPGPRSSIGQFFSIFTDFGISSSMGAASKTLSLATIANLAPFYFFLNRKKYQSVRGLLMSMVLILVLIVLYKFVWQ